MARRRRRQGAATRGRATVDTSTRRRRVQADRRRPEAPKTPKTKKKEKRSYLGPIPLLHPGEFGADIFHPFSLVGRAVERIPSRATRLAGRISQVIGSSPGYVAENPRATGRGIKRTVVGAAEAPYGIYQARTGGKGWRSYGKGESWEKIGKVFAKEMEKDYRRRYGEDWREAAEEDPLSNFLDALSLLGGGARAGSLVGAAGRLGEASEAGRIATSLRHPVKLWQESSIPGRYRRGPDGELVEGEPLPRTIGYVTSKGTIDYAEQTPSRSPTRRLFQRYNDAMAMRHPGTPVVGARARVSRAKANTVARSINRAFASLGNMPALNGLNEAELTRIFWGEQMGEDTAEALKMVRAALKNEYDGPTPEPDTEFAQLLLQAKQVGFGKKVVERLDKAIALAEKVPEGSARYQRGIEAMRELTDMAEQVQMDTHGFSDDTNEIRRLRDRAQRVGPEESQEALDQAEELADGLVKKDDDLESMFRNRRSRVRDWVYENAPFDSPERDAWGRELRRLGWDDDRVLTALAFADRMARRTTPKDPGSWWRDRMGMPTEESAAEFVQRMGPSENARYQSPMEYLEAERRAYSKAGYSSLVEPTGILAHRTVFYSPLQKWAAEEMPRRMTKEQMVATIAKKQITGEELRNSGLELFFGEYENGDFIYKQDFIEHLSSTLNAYNLHETYRVLGRDDPALSTKWAGYQMGALLSRSADNGEYREIVMTLPHTPEGRETYAGRGVIHWGDANVVAHVRFHVFEEDGKRKLLIEEIQSDWAADVRRAKAEPYNLDPDAPWQERKAQLDEFRERLWQRAEEVSAEGRWLSDMDAEIARLEDSGVPGDQKKAELLIQEVDSRNARWLQDKDALDREELELGLLDDQGFQRSPLGDRYYRAVIRRMAREAVEEQVDEIILIDPGTQKIRNAEEGHRLFERDEIEDHGAPLWWDEDIPGDETVHSHEMTNYERGEDHGTWGRLYGEGFPDFFRKEYGVTPEHSRAAYQGRYTQLISGGRTRKGDMPGTVIKVTDDFREKAMVPRALYQRAPDWGRLPKGATELIGSKTAMRMFERGDISTWVHELAHIGFHDLDEAQRRVVEQEFGGGKPIEEWNDAHHENYARAFERYIRDGEAPTSALQPIFTKLSMWIRGVWEQAKVEYPEISEDARKVFDSMLVRRDDTIPQSFIPHRAGDPNLRGGRISKGMPRADRVLGDSVRSRIPLYKKNRLALVRSGLINDDPRALVEHGNRVLMLARANQLREAIVELAVPLKPGEPVNFKDEYVIKRTGTSVDKPYFDALEATDDPKQVEDTVSSFLNDHITDSEKRWEEWKADNPRQQLYVVDKKVVDMLVKNVTGGRVGAPTKPTSTASKILDAALDSTRAGLLYTNPGFYMANLAGNSMMMMLSDPMAARFLVGSLRQARRASSGRTEEKTDRTWRRISVEMGRGPTAGGLSDGRPKVGGYKIQGGKRKAEIPGDVAEAVSSGLSAYGRRAGRVIDDAFRVAAWKQAARKHGVKGDEEINELLDNANTGSRAKMIRSNSPAAKKLAAIRDEAEQLMLDFDSMTPFEKEWMMRLVFLYPFLKASAKWPFMYAGERPISAGVLGQAALQGQAFAETEEALGPRPELPTWMEGYARAPGGVVNVGSVMPQMAFTELLATLTEMNKEPVLGVSSPFDYLNPLYQYATQLAQGRDTFGKGKPRAELAAQELPMPGMWRTLLQGTPVGRKPSKVWEDREALSWQMLMRALRLPSEINEREARTVARSERKKKKTESRGG